MKRNVWIISISMILLLFTSCTDTRQTEIKNSPEPTKQVSVEPSKKAVTLVVKKDKAKYIQSNELVVQSVDKTIQTSKNPVQINLMRIGGLKNKNLQDSINASIEKFVEDSIKEYTISSNEEISSFFSSLELDANNIISVVLYGGSGGIIASHTYSLIDGSIIDLSDIFTKGTDYVSLLNREIIESILSGEAEESDILSEPFSTISPNQSFYLNQYSLNILFKKGESGFANGYQITIPLYKIDDYMDLFDRQDLNADIYENPAIIIKRNNIFLNDINERTKINNINITVRYPVISGMKNTAAQNNINKLLKGKVDKFLNSGNIKNPANNSIAANAFGSIFIDTCFNSCGYICFTVNSYLDTANGSIESINENLLVELKSGNTTNIKEILNNYSHKNGDFKENFTNIIKSRFISQSSPDNKQFIEKNVDYDFILNNCNIYLIDYYYGSEPSIVVNTKNDSDQKYAEMYGSAAFNTDLHTSLESFLSN